MTGPSPVEGFAPVANRPPGESWAGALRFCARSLLDLQVASVLWHLRPWLNGCRGSVLEVGCGAQPYRHLLPAGCHYTGLDWDQAGEHFHYRMPDTVYYQGGRFPFEESSFDHLFHTVVLEHIFEAPQFLAECRRVLRPSGTMLFTVPFQARYHYIPHDYFRYTPAALERLLQEAGFREIAIRPRGTDLTVAAYKNVSVLYRWARSGAIGAIAALLLSPAALCSLVLGAATLRGVIGSSDDCLGYTVTATA